MSKEYYKQINKSGSFDMKVVLDSELQEGIPEDRVYLRRYQKKDGFTVRKKDFERYYTKLKIKKNKKKALTKLSFLNPF